jgi:hypothetical protein
VDRALRSSPACREIRSAASRPTLARAPSPRRHEGMRHARARAVREHVARFAPSHAVEQVLPLRLRANASSAPAHTPAPSARA